MKTFLLLAIFLCILGVFAEDCSNWNGQQACQSGSQTENPPDWAERAFQTPPYNTTYYRPSYQDMAYLVGYARVQYNPDRTSATVTVVTRVNTAKLRPGSYQLHYRYDGKTAVTDNTLVVSQATHSNRTLSIHVILINHDLQYVPELFLEPVDFIWNNPVVKQGPEYENGQKGAIIEMFGWPYEDIEKECEAIGKMGYLGVKVFPPQEAIQNFDMPEEGQLNPWYWIYQPVSYKLTSRWGTRDQLRKMINTCRSHGVRVYADAVINHMTGNGNDMFPSHRAGNGGYCNYWGAKNATAGSPYYSQGYAYQLVNFTGQRPGMEYPAVPYGPLDFHCERSLSSWSDPFALNYAWLVGLADLNTESEYVQQRIADYLTELLSIGFSGFRVDAAKHIKPDDLAAIFAKFKHNLGGGDLPADFIAYLEVIIGGEKDLLFCQENNYNFGTYFASAMKREGLSDSDVYKIKIWSSDYPKEFPICGYWVIPSEREVAENDCHDDQFAQSSSRDMGDKGSVLVREKDVPKHRFFEKQLFTRTDGNWKIKLVLSSYTFRSNGAVAPPDGLSDCNLCTNSECKQKCTKSMPYSAAHDPNVCGYTCVKDGSWQEGVYTRVHRDMGIILAMRQWMGLPATSNPVELGLPSFCTAE
jgi:alpha-amylase